MEPDSADRSAHNRSLYNVGLTEEELNELILLIDDDPVDEEFLLGIRRKLAHKRRLLRARMRQETS